MLHRLLAVAAFPAHLLNRALAEPLGRIGLGRVPGALLAGMGILLLAISTGSAVLAAGESRPEPRASSIAEVADGRVASSLWIEFDAELIDGPHRADVQVNVGGGRAAQTVERVHYLVADPTAPDKAVIVRFAEPIDALDAAAGPVRLDGTITEDPFNMRSLLDGWDVADRYPDLEFSDSRLIAYAFATPFVEPSWVGTVVMAAIAGILLLGAFVPQPVLRLVGATPREGQTPIELAIHGTLTTPRGAVRLHGTPARLEWMNVEEVARTLWRYWGAGLGDVRQVVEDAVRAHGREGERLVIHGPSGSVIWPVEAEGGLEIVAGEAFSGLTSHPALRVRADGSRATLTFADEARRDAALAELRRGEGGR
jgi:hypothetical protein